MSWTAHFYMDDDKDAGTAVAVWNEGLDDEWSISHRVEAAKASLAKFCDWAKAQKAAVDALAPKEQKAVTYMEAQLNG